MRLLADRILYKKNWGSITRELPAFGEVNTKLLQNCAQALYGAKIISLDDATAGTAYELSLELHPDTILESIDYFRLPAKRVWIEFRRDAFLPETPKGTTGFLLEKFSDEGFSITLVDEETRDFGNHISPSMVKFFFSLNPQDLIGRGNIKNLSFRQRTFYALGMQYEPGSTFAAGTELDKVFKGIAGFADDMQNDSWHRVSEHFEFNSNLAGLEDQFEGFSDIHHHYLREVAGTIRHVLAIILLYHFPPVEKYQRKPQSGRRIVNGQSKPYFSFEELTIRLPKRKPSNPYKWVKNGLPKPEHRKRAHDVDGHWRRLRKLTDAEILALGRPRASLVPHEFFKHTWVREHQRGDARIGFVRKRKHLVS